MSAAELYSARVLKGKTHVIAELIGESRDIREIAVHGRSKFNGTVRLQRESSVRFEVLWTVAANLTGI